MKNALLTPTSLRRRIADLQAEVDALTDQRDRLLRAVARAERLNWQADTGPVDGSLAGESSVYVLDDDAAEARAFDDFYRAYDDGHAKTRKFLLG